MKNKFLTLAALMLVLGSCGNKADEKESASVTIDEETASGSANDYYVETDEDVADVEYGEIDGLDEDDAASAALSSAEIDDMLDGYEEFVDKYISLFKKASKGDLSAIADCEAYLESGETLSLKVQSISSLMNAAQMKRYTEITAKMGKAASEISFDAIDAVSDITSQAGEYMDVLNNLSF